MSALIHVKGLLLSEMKHTHPDIKKAILNLINAIDSDLDIHGYEHGSHIDKRIIELDRAICEVYEEKDALSDALLEVKKRKLQSQKGDIPAILMED